MKAESFSNQQKQSQAEGEPSFALASILKGLQRTSAIRGMEDEKVQDPIAQEILEMGPENIREVDLFLRNNGITTLAPLEEGHGFSAVVLDAGDKVVRLSRMKPTEKPNVPYVHPPLISEIIAGLSIQISKKLETENITEADVESMQNKLKAIGYRWDDAGTDNLGRDENGNLLIIDGSVRPVDEEEK